MMSRIFRLRDGTPAPEPTSGPFIGTQDRGGLALVLTGGGARGAYQVGVLRFLARRYPELQIPVITGVSAGAINVALLAQHHGTFPQAVEELRAVWSELTPDRIFRVDAPALARNIGRWGVKLMGAGYVEPRARGLMDTGPLRQLMEDVYKPVNGELTGIDYNLHRGTLRAVALGTTNYTTGQSVVWVQGRDIQTWQRPMRRAVQTRLRIDHVMASAALPLFFPAVQIGSHWHGDGGIRLTAPLSPALHLGAHKILAIANRHAPTYREAATPVTAGYPPPAQVIGVLYESVFLDLVDQDAVRMQRMNILLKKLPEEQREGMRVVDLLVMRPSRDLAALAADYEPRLPRAFRLLTRGLGTRETSTPDVLSMMMFQDDYVKRLIALGERDAEARAEEFDDFLSDCVGGPGAAVERQG
jgi:NTE family protein